MGGGWGSEPPELTSGPGHAFQAASGGSPGPNTRGPLGPTPRLPAPPSPRAVSLCRVLCPCPPSWGVFPLSHGAPGCSARRHAAEPVLGVGRGQGRRHPARPRPRAQRRHFPAVFTAGEPLRVAWDPRETQSRRAPGGGGMLEVTGQRGTREGVADEGPWGHVRGQTFRNGADAAGEQRRPPRAGRRHGEVEGQRGSRAQVAGADTRLTHPEGARRVLRGLGPCGKRKEEPVPGVWAAEGTRGRL